jgi:hypothetical protein
MPRGRRSQASLCVVPPAIPGAGRPDPPTHLDASEAQIWRAVVGALPNYWIDAAGEQILLRLVAQAAIAERHERRLRELRAQQSPDEPAIAALSTTHGIAAKVITHLLASLRATPRSRMVSRAAGPKVGEVPRSKPWDTGA